MAPLLNLDPARRARESERASRADRDERAWRRSWLVVYAHCAVLSAVGTAVYAWSWGRTGDSAAILSTLGQVIAYVLPFFRLVVFFVKQADRF